MLSPASLRGIEFVWPRVGGAFNLADSCNNILPSSLSEGETIMGERLARQSGVWLVSALLPPLPAPFMLL
eukprot:1028793-Lingulodinium_polyedra.AAC.1